MVSVFNPAGEHRHDVDTDAKHAMNTSTHGPGFALDKPQLPRRHTRGGARPVMKPWGAGIRSLVRSCRELRGATQGNSSARASTMRGRVGVIFLGRGFKSHRRRILQFYFQRKRGRVGSKISAVVIMKGAVVQRQHFQFWIPRFVVRFPPVALLDFLGFFIFSSLFVVR